MQEARHLRRATAWAMIALYGLVASGLPLPVGLPPEGSAASKQIAGKDRSKPFPCMDKACGCETAERCFSSCCCHTPAETLAWAKARGIEASVIDALARRVAAATAAKPAGGCCSMEASEPEPSCCSSETDEIDEAICSDYQSLAADPPACPMDSPSDDEAPADLTIAGNVVILRDMLACQGVASWWASMVVSLPPPSCVTCDLSWPKVGTLASADMHVPGTGSPPDLPPPRGC